MVAWVRFCVWGVWKSKNLIELDWIGLYLIELDWIGLDWNHDERKTSLSPTPGDVGIIGGDCFAHAWARVPFGMK